MKRIFGSRVVRGEERWVIDHCLCPCWHILSHHLPMWPWPASGSYYVPQFAVFSLRMWLFTNCVCPFLQLYSTCTCSCIVAIHPLTTYPRIACSPSSRGAPKKPFTSLAREKRNTAAQLYPTTWFHMMECGHTKTMNYCPHNVYDSTILTMSLPVADPGNRKGGFKDWHFGLVTPTFDIIITSYIISCHNLSS